MAVNAMSTFNGGSVSARAEYFCGPSEADQEAAGPGREDYYVGAVDDLGGSAWIGAGAEKLGLTGQPISADSFAQVFGGIDPNTGQRFDGKGAQPFGEKERAGYEMALNVDKSLSVLYAVAGDDAKRDIENAILKAHDSMFNLAIEKGYFQTRIGAQGKGGTVAVEDVTAARFLHGTNRNQDPHLHVHCEISSVVFDQGKPKKLAEIELFKRQKEMAFLFDSYLAENLNDLGLSLTENEHGLVVAGIKEDALKEFSSRRREIMEAMEAMGEGSKGNRDLNLQVTMSGRAEKADALDKEGLYIDWQERARAFGYTQEFIAEQKAMGHDFRDFAQSDELEALLLSNRSVFTDYDFDRVAAQFSIGRGGPDAIDRIRSNLIERLDLVCLPNDQYTTRKVYENEKAVMTSAMGRAGEAAHTIDESKVTAIVQAIRAEAKQKAIEDGRDPEAVNGLNPEQENALYHLASRSGGLAVLEGAAGTGKSFTMAAVKRAFEGDGFKVTGLAPSGKAADELQNGSSIESRTIHSLLLKLENGKADLTTNDVLVVDEAGMADSIALARLTDYAHEAGAKLILTGDSQQLDAVGTANLLREIGEEIGNARLTKIARQKDPELKGISQAMFENKGAVGEAIDRLEKRGMLHHATDENAAIDQAVSRYLELADKWGHTETLLLAQTNEKVDLLNDRVREHLIEKGELNQKDAVKVIFEDDREREREEFIMPGDRVMCRKNDRELGVSNGTLATVESIEDATLTIRVDDTDERIAINLDEYRNLDLAWAMTVHKSQGMTVQGGVGLGDRWDNRSAYVNFTRGREGMETVTTLDKEEFTKAVAKESTKPTTIAAHTDRETGVNRLKEDLRTQAGASRAAADRAEQADLATTERVLTDEFRHGVAGDLDRETWHGKAVALTDEDRQIIEHWKTREAERISEILATEQETMAQEREPEKEREPEAADLYGNDQGEEFNPEAWEIDESEQAEAASDHATAADQRERDENYMPPPPPPPPPEDENSGPGMG